MPENHEPTAPAFTHDLLGYVPAIAWAIFVAAESNILILQSPQVQRVAEDVGLQPSAMTLAIFNWSASATTLGGVGFLSLTALLGLAGGVWFGRCRAARCDTRNLLAAAVVACILVFFIVIAQMIALQADASIALAVDTSGRI